MSDPTRRKGKRWTGRMLQFSGPFDPEGFSLVNPEWYDFDDMDDKEQEHFKQEFNVHEVRVTITPITGRKGGKQ